MARVRYPHKPQALWAALEGILTPEQMRRLIAFDEENQRAVEDASEDTIDSTDGVLVAVAYSATEGLPSISHTSDGVEWRAASEPAKSENQGGSNGYPGVWTGDRFLVWISSASGTHSSLLQSFDGHTWAWHDDNTLFPRTATVYGIYTNGTGLVFAVIDGNRCALSTDSGATWAAVVPGGAFFGVGAVGGQTIVVLSDASARYSLNGGVTWASATFDVGFAGLTTIDGIVFCGVESFWLMDDNSAGVGILWKTSNFTSWTKVPTAGDEDWPHSVTYNGGNVSGIEAEGIFSGGEDGNSIVILANSPGVTNNGKILCSPDAGVTWYIITDYDDAATFAGTALEPDVIGALFPHVSNTEFKTGAAYAFGSWWITNEETYYNARDTPPMLKGSADFQTWEALVLPWEIIGNLGYDVGTEAWGPLIFGTPQPA